MGQRANNYTVFKVSLPITHTPHLHNNIINVRQTVLTIQNKLYFAQQTHTDRYYTPYIYIITGSICSPDKFHKKFAT